ncbi:MAG: heat-inducible transcriptional repressor HrcA, partial [Pyrinomonadaceae bacterium]
MAILSANSNAQTDRMPDARGQAVLSAIIREHLHTGEPVGSRVISERFAGASGWSSATIRNVMGELEDAGLVEQPHTSAGRVPTDKGYRFYVDHLTGDTRLSRADMSAIDRSLGLPKSDVGTPPNRLMEKVSHLLSQLSENVGIVVSPALVDNRLQHLEFLQLADSRVLVVLVFASNVVQNKIIRVDEPLSQDELERTARYLNTEFSGKSLQTMRNEILGMMREEKALYDKLLRNAVLLCEMSLEGEESETGDVYVDGASNIIAKPDFGDIERLRELFRTFETKSRLVKILNECIAGDPVFADVHVVIGRENSAPSLQSCALITA